MNKLKLGLACLVAFFGFQSYAQNLKIVGDITRHDGVCCEDRLYIRPMSKLSDPSSKPIGLTNGKFVMQLKTTDRFFTIIAIDNERQYILPYYHSTGGDTMYLALSVTPEGLTIKSPDANNRALEAYRKHLMELSGRLWKEGKTLSSEEIKAILQELKDKATTIPAEIQCVPEVAQYISIWAYTTLQDLYEGLSFITDKTPNELNIDKASLLAPPKEVLDNKIASYFFSTARIVLSSLKGESLKERFAEMYQSYKSPEVLLSGADMLIQNFTSKFDFSTGYEEGLTALEEIVAQYKLDKKYVLEFKRKKASVVGTPFPEHIHLRDLEGNKVDFSQFRGKYVYIDLWASWCAPCIKEIPHLKKIEHELQNKDVVFLSVSIDTNEQAWHAKVKDLDMKGYQVIDLQNDLPKALNISGIPFFVIYDKEGKLYKYSAPRPSKPETKKLLEGLH